MQVQNIIVSDITADEATVEIQIGEQPDLDGAAEYVVASVKLQNPDQARTMGKLQLDALHEAQRIVAAAAAEIERELSR